MKEEIVVAAEGLGKEYQIGRRREARSTQTFAEVVAGSFKRIFPVHAGRRQADQGDRVTTESYWALRDLNFEIKRGEVVGVIGRNGAGKSTLLKILSRITEPTEGRVSLRGRVSSLLEVGTGFHPELTGRENIYLNGAILGMRSDEIRRKFDEIVNFAGVEKFLDTPVKRYSSGMYVRLAFAVAAHLEPEILIVDEVLAVGDAEFQRRCLEKMEDVGKHGRTVIFVSHQMDAVQRLCKRCIMLEAGRVTANNADVEAVIRQYVRSEKIGRWRSDWVRREGDYEDPHFSPTRMYLSKTDGRPVEVSVANDAPLHLHIEGWCGEPRRNLMVGFALYNERHQSIFWSFNTDGSEECWPAIKRGSNHIVCELPRRLLNEGHYRLQLLTLLCNEQWLLDTERSGIGVEIAIVGGMSDSPLWLGVRPTIFAPVLNWKSNGSSMKSLRTNVARNERHPSISANE